MQSPSQVSDTVPPAVGGHPNKPDDPLAVSTDESPDAELPVYGPVFSQCRASSSRTLFYKNPVQCKAH